MGLDNKDSQQLKKIADELRQIRLALVRIAVALEERRADPVDAVTHHRHHRIDVRALNEEKPSFIEWDDLGRS